MKTGTTEQAQGQLVIAFFVLAAVTTFFAEYMGNNYGWFFGSYDYTETLGPRIGGVAVLILFVWGVVIYSAYMLVDWLMGLGAVPRGKTWFGKIVWSVLIALATGVVLCAWDLMADPFAVSGDGQFLVDQFSDVSTPTITSIVQSDGTPVHVLGKCAGPSIPLPKVTREFLKIKAHDGTDLYTQIVKPENFDAKKKYPVVIHWYGGPTLQLVSNRYGATNLFNHIERDTLYTQAGFIVWRLDNRGSFGRGHAFETPIYKEFGKAALDDQLAGVEYLRTLPYIDATRIGTDGKSFGGFLTLYALIHAPEVFKAGVAGSGPTDWAYYDTIYTERYMQQPSQNKAGYAATNIINRAADFKATPLIIHGLSDTNVHLQNSVNLIQQLEHLDKPFLFIPLPNSDHHYGGDGLATVLAASTDYFVQRLGAP